MLILAQFPASSYSNLGLSSHLIRNFRGDETLLDLVEKLNEQLVKVCTSTHAERITRDFAAVLQQV